MKVKTVFPWLLLVAAASTRAQDAPDGGWHFLVEPYAMFPNMKGDTGIGNLPPVHVDEDPQDIFDNLQIGAMLFVGPAASSESEQTNVRCSTRATSLASERA